MKAGYLQRLTLGFAFLAGLIACENDLSEVNAVFSNDELQAEVAKEVEILYSDSAVLRVRVKGPVMLRIPDIADPREEFPEGVAVDFFDETGEINSWLTARKGLRLSNKGQVVVRDSVVWQSANQDRLETEELIWDERTQKVYTDKFVVVRRPEEIIYGYGFESDQNFTRSRIRAIQGRLKVEDLDKKSEN